MSAPLVVNTVDGTCWTRRKATRDGQPLYAMADCARCPELVMATYAELAEHGIVGSADALPVPAGSVPQPLSAERLAEIEARANAATDGPWCTDSWEIYQGSEYEPGLSFWIGETCRGTADLEQDRADAAFVAAARSDVPALVAEIRRLWDERRSTNEALDDAVQELRARREDAAALPWAHAMSGHDLHGFLDDLVSAAMGRWQSDPEVPDREVLAAVEKACADWRMPGQGNRLDGSEFDGVTVQALRESLPSAGWVAETFSPKPAEGEHYASTHHDYLKGRDLDLPGTGGAL